MSRARESHRQRLTRIAKECVARTDQHGFEHLFDRVFNETDLSIQLKFVTAIAKHAPAHVVAVFADCAEEVLEKDYRQCDALAAARAAIEGLGFTMSEADRIVDELDNKRRAASPAEGMTIQ